MKCVGLICLLASLLLAGDAGGIRPRESSADYTAHQTVSGVTFAAAVIPPDQVKKLFATDLNAGGYIVIELAIYPEAGQRNRGVMGRFSSASRVESGHHPECECQRNCRRTATQEQAA
jgi:hypothetical protein